MIIYYFNILGASIARFKTNTPLVVDSYAVVSFSIALQCWLKYALYMILVGDPGVLNRLCCVGVAELPLNRCDIAGFLYVVPAHGMVGAMRSVSPYPGQTAHFVEHRIDNPGVETTVAVGVGYR